MPQCYSNVLLFSTRLETYRDNMFYHFLSFQVVINVYKAVVRFGLIHMAATNMCCWASTVILETTEAFHAHAHHDASHDEGHGDTSHGLSSEQHGKSVIKMIIQS